MFIVNGIRILTGYGNDTDCFKRIGLQVPDIGNIYVRARCNPAFEVSWYCGHIKIEGSITSGWKNLEDVCIYSLYSCQKLFFGIGNLFRS